MEYVIRFAISLFDLAVLNVNLLHFARFSCKV